MEQLKVFDNAKNMMIQGYEQGAHEKNIKKHLLKKVKKSTVT